MVEATRWPPLRRSANRAGVRPPCSCAHPSERTLWPEFVALCDELHAHLDKLTTRVIREAINDDVSEATEQAATPKALPEPASAETIGPGPGT